jgi:hypothetical protein
MKKHVITFLATLILILFTRNVLADSPKPKGEEVKLPEFSNRVMNQGTKYLNEPDCEVTDDADECSLSFNLSGDEEVPLEQRDSAENNSQPFKNRTRSGTMRPADETSGRAQRMRQGRTPH